MLGYPNAALADLDHALSDAREIGQAATLMVTLVVALLTHICCGNYETANLLADELVALSEAKGALLWNAVGRIIRGDVLSLLGKSSDAVQMITAGIGAEKATGATLWMPWFVSSLALAHAELEKFEDAGRCIDEAMTAAEITKERWYEAEVNRIAGEIARKSPEPDAAKSEAYFERALTVARQQQARSWELRAAISLARLWRDQGKGRRASARTACSNFRLVH
jgi:predicted ATPase